MEKEWVTVREAADRLGVARATVYKWAKEGRIPIYKLGLRVARIRTADLQELLARARPLYENSPADKTARQAVLKKTKGAWASNPAVDPALAEISGGRNERAVREDTAGGTRRARGRAAPSRTPNRAALRRFCTRHDVTFLGMFGSFARGEDRPDSDVDLLVRPSRPKSLLELVAMEEELAVLFGRKVDLLTEAALSPYLRDAILREMVVLYERTG